MSAKHVLPWVVLLALAGPRAADAQPDAGSGSNAPFLSGAPIVPPPPSSPSSAILTGAEPVSPAAQNWQAANSPAFCCGPVGANGPIGSEIFLNSGVSIPSSGGVLFPQLRTGWMEEWGGRTLLFNRANDAAWTAKISWTFNYNRVGTGVPPFQFFGLPVRARDLFRWSYTWGAGRDWFLIGNRDSCSSHLRFGFETGGRWGTEHLNMLLDINDPLNVNNYIRRQGVFGAYYLGLHLDYEIPMGSWVFVAGFRGEHDWEWSSLLPGQDNSLRDVNLLWSIGFRY